MKESEGYETYFCIISVESTLLSRVFARKVLAYRLYSLFRRVHSVSEYKFETGCYFSSSTRENPFSLFLFLFFLFFFVRFCPFVRDTFLYLHIYRWDRCFCHFFSFCETFIANRASISFVFFSIFFLFLFTTRIVYEIYCVHSKPY